MLRLSRNMNPSPNITDLPLEVLGLIFKELPNVKEQIRLAQVHPHIGLAFSCHFRQRLRNLNICDLTVNERSVVLPLCGSSVDYINGYYSFDDTKLKLVEHYCPNLQSIEVELSEENINGIKSILANVRSLRSIILVARSTVGKHLPIVELLKFQPSLRKLHLYQFCVDDLLEVRNLVNLEELIIVNSSNNTLNINELCYRLKKLRTLQIKNMVFAASNEFDEVPCPALRELHLYYFCATWQNPSTTAILKWILSHAETLEILKLGKPHSEPEKVICKILSECRNLRFLCIPIDNVHTGFAHRLFRILSESGVISEKRPLNLNFHNQSIHDDIKKLMANTSAKRFITFKNFCCKKCVT